ncbi:preprotein translocase subunit YajC [Nocardioides sp. TF02-7]|uniref:preprotein translocase subunit YajC n=1 Tax=Nocardioides sp. TF02-7 TaxID=2917724 RepID=UPI001F06A3BD|nr:preprotein translocase subunit YajC [Nocardioides sp. TF02-7]UMG92652.1 preprotein translocase subunit YajC [Nocardioides sp. TF02-7]
MAELAPFLWIVAIAAIFWLLIIRPASRRQKQIAQVQASVTVGDEVVLTSGIFGTITETADAHVMVEVAPGTAIKVARGAIGQVVPDELAPDIADPEAVEVSDDNQKEGER